MESRFNKIVVTVLAVVILAVLFMGFVFRVNTGEVAIISRFGEVKRIAEPGLHFKLPFVESKMFMRTREQTIKFGAQVEGAPDDAPYITATTKDMQTIKIALTVSDVTTDPLKLYKAFTGNHVRSLMIPRVKDTVQSEVAKYTIENFVSSREEMVSGIFSKLEKDFEPYGLTLTDVSIVDYKFSESYEAAVDAKKVAEQEVEVERRRQEKAIVEAETRVKLAELEIKRKEAEAKANKVETESLSDLLLKKQMIEKWNGKLPQVLGGDRPLVSVDMFEDRGITNNADNN